MTTDTGWRKPTRWHALKPGLTGFALLGLVAACGQGNSMTGNGRSGGTASGGSGNSQPNGQGSSVLGVQALDSYVPATPAQYAAGARYEGIIYSLRTALTSACMRPYGFNQPVGLGISEAAFVAQDVDNSQFPDLARIARTKEFVPLTGYPNPPSLPAAQQRAFNADNVKCGRATEKPFKQLLSAGGEMEQQWLGILYAVQASPPVQAKLAGFATCVEHAGAPAEWSGTFEHFLAWVTGVQTHVHGMRATKAVEAHWAPIFVRCAGPALALQDHLLLAKRAEFLQQHYQQVQQLQELAVRLIPRVERQYKLSA